MELYIFYCRSPRWEKCVKAAAGLGAPYLFFTSGSLTNAVGAMYAKKYFNKGERKSTILTKIIR